MSVSIVVEGKVVGQKRPLFTDWRVELPPLHENRGDHLKLRDLITSIVIKEVEAFRLRQEERKLARVMSRQQIEQGAIGGKVDPGEHDIQQEVNIDEAIAIAMQAFEDGLYFVFIDEVQQAHLDSEVFLKTNSKVMFLRLTALVGG
ncbi:MAG TPA: hypothetical protein VK206_11590 [Anaerolineales bacterium]|nr:hypothetical protein [Anaerolineales bacterium]